MDKGRGCVVRSVLLGILWALLLQVGILLVLDQNGMRPVEKLFGEAAARRLRLEPLNLRVSGAVDERCLGCSCAAVAPPEAGPGLVVAPPTVTADSPLIPQEEGEGAHRTEALFFVFEGLVLGIAVLHLTMFEAFRSLQHTVVLFVLGLLYALAHENQAFLDRRVQWGNSYKMWMGIDSHLLLYTMLPPLLLGEAMSIDTSVVATVFRQCLYLAGPGVLINAILTALFVQFLLGWNFMLCLLFGAIASATDPVAVVNLLKDLGGPPTLTVMIQGEALLNDGTAIVLYTIIYSYIAGSSSYSIGGIVLEFVRVALGAVCLGIFCGMVFNAWIHGACSRLSHIAGQIQICLTICCAYVSWVFAEGFFQVSGVLCTVTAAIVLAEKMWPAVTHREAMEDVWHTIEFILNTILFFLAGALTGRTIFERTIVFRDFLELLAIYAVVILIRFAVLFFSKPILNLLGKDGSHVSTKDVLVMTWGGLRGAVGLALAIQVQKDRAGGVIKESEGGHVLFFIGGIACLTLVINASTCAALVRVLGITRTTSVKRWLMMGMHRNLEEMLKEETEAKMSLARRNSAQSQNSRMSIGTEAAKKRGEAVSEMVVVALKEVAKDVQLGHDHGHPTLAQARLAEEEASLGSSMELSASGNRLYDNLRRSTGTAFSGLVQNLASTKPPVMDAKTLELLAAYDGMLEMWEDHNARGRFRPFPDLACAYLTKDDLHDCRTQAASQTANYKIMRAMNEALLNLVRAQYWAQIEEGLFAKGTAVAELLLGSLPPAFKQAGEGLTDLHYIMVSLGYKESLVASLFEVDPERQRVAALSPVAPQRPAQAQPPHSGVAGASAADADAKDGGKRGEAQQEPALQDEAASVGAAAKAVMYRMDSLGSKTLEASEEGSHLAIIRMNTPSDVGPEASQGRTFSEKTEPAQPPQPPQPPQALQPQQHGGGALLTPTSRPVAPAAKAARGLRKMKTDQSMVSLVPDIPELEDHDHHPLHFVAGWTFNFVMMMVIFVNSAAALVKMNDMANPEREIFTMTEWLIMRGGLFLCFLLEFILKYMYMRRAYWHDLENIFDALVITITFTSLVEEVVRWQEAKDRDLLLKLTLYLQCFRWLRIFRFVSLMRMVWSVMVHGDQGMHSAKLAASMRRIMVLKAYIKAHLKSQKDLLKLFGKSSMPENSEEALCILESQTNVFRAFVVLGKEAVGVDLELLEEINVLHDGSHIVKQMSHFVDGAYSGGAINHRQARRLLKPLEDLQTQLQEALDHPSHGFIHKTKAIRTRYAAGSVAQKQEGQQVAHEPESVAGSQHAALKGGQGDLQAH